VMRFTTTGTLDTTWGATGQVEVFPQAFADQANAIRVQNDGKVVVAGWTTNAAGNHDVMLFRMTSAGAMDTTFGASGFTFVNVASFDDEGNGVVIQPDGGIVVAGSSRTASGAASAD